MKMVTKVALPEMASFKGNHRTSCSPSHGSLKNEKPYHPQRCPGYSPKDMMHFIHFMRVQLFWWEKCSTVKSDWETTVQLIFEKHESTYTLVCVGGWLLAEKLAQDSLPTKDRAGQWAGDFPRQSRAWRGMGQYIASQIAFPSICLPSGHCRYKPFYRNPSCVKSLLVQSHTIVTQTGTQKPFVKASDKAEGEP